MKKLLSWLQWLMILPFGLFLYIGVKGCVYLLTIRYEGSGSLIPLVSDFLLGGILGIALILVISYALAPQGKIAAVVFVALFCITVGVPWTFRAPDPFTHPCRIPPPSAAALDVRLPP